MMKQANLLVLTFTALATGCSSEPEVGPYGTTQQLMAQEMQPAADTYWQSVGASSELVNGEAVFREWQPETDAEWAEVVAATRRLQELGATLKTPAYAAGRGEAWNAYAQGLIDAAKVAEQSALDRDAEAILDEVGYTVYSVCSACHRTYPPETLPEGVTVDDLAAN